MSSDLEERTIAAGDLVDLYDEGNLVTGVVTGTAKGRLHVVTETGREIRVNPSRIALRIPGTFAVENALEAAAAHAALVSEVAGDIEVPTVWDALVDQGGKKRHDLADLALLALGDSDAVSLSAMLRALQPERKYFVRKGDRYEARSREQVEEARKREAAERAREERRNTFVGVARAALLKGVPPPEEGGGLDRKLFGDMVADLVELSIMGEEAPSRKGGLSLLDDAGVPPGPPMERAFHLLRVLGIFGEHENLFIHRFGLRSSFEPEVTEAAQAVVGNGWKEEGRLDLSGSFCLTIDDAATTEIDDALGAEPATEEREGAVRLAIHIADPGSFVKAGDLVDQEAMIRGATYYFPEVKLPMLPSSISEEAASLVAGEKRPALSFLVTLSAEGEVIRSEITRSVIRAAARLTYEETDQLLEEEAPAEDRTVTTLRLLGSLADSLEQKRIETGAVIIRAPEVNVTVAPDGHPVVTRIDDRGRARRMVSEMMILANRLAAEFCLERGVPAIYRRQPPPLSPVPPAGLDPEYDPVAIRSARRSMRRGETGVEPGPHYGLGVEAYTQVTSPIRRYQDLAMQRQLSALLDEEAPAYDSEALARIAATTDEAEKAAREAERGTDEYWILRFYEERIGESIEGIVLQSDRRRTEIELTDTLYTLGIPPSPAHAPGMTLRLRIEEVRPRGRRLRLSEERK